MSTFSIKSTPLHTRPFLGLGVQADAYIFDEYNKRLGVNEKDFELIANRIQHLRPAIVRMFVEVPWFDHLEVEGTTASPMYAALVRQLRLFAETGALVNLVLFQPMPHQAREMEPHVRRMLVGLNHLINKEGLAHIRWLTLWNEPESLFGHGSPLTDRLFKKTRGTWDEYVRLNRLTYQLLGESGLRDTVKLIVCDAAWGPLVRKERMEISFAAFQDLDVAYSIHSYSHEKEINNVANPDYLYFGIEQEIRGYRELIGEDRELALWEFNTSGFTGFGTFFAGVGPHGEERISSVEGAAELAEKAIAGISGGLDGTAVWCLHDMKYGGEEVTPPMMFGLWRFKWHNWFPRPIYHYYGALMAAFRPGARIHRVTHDVPNLKSVAAKYDDGEVVAMINTEGTPLTVPLTAAPDARLLRIAPSRLPATCELPLHLTAGTEPLTGASLVLEPWELALVITGRTTEFP